MARSLASDIICRFEGCKLTSYPDPASARAEHLRETGVDDKSLDGRPWTIGYGCTGPGIVEGLVWTQEQAEAAVEHRVQAVEDLVKSWCTREPTERQLAAMTSLAYNIGTGAFHDKAEVLRDFNSGDLQAAADAFRHWTKAKGKVLTGLVNRRETERALFLSGAS